MLRTQDAFFRRHGRRASGRLIRRVAAGAFTLIKLLVAIAIIGIPASMLLPALARAKSRAHQTVCLNNIEPVGLALNLYAEKSDDKTPESPDGVVNFVASGKPNYLGSLVPYLGFTQIVARLFPFPSTPSKHPITGQKRNGTPFQHEAIGVAFESKTKAVSGLYIIAGSAVTAYLGAIAIQSE